jgi:drug/metabolite transporter (DMT)-like permease
MLQWVGISIAFLGIVVTFLGREEVHSTATQAMISNTLFGDFLALLAGLLWALTTISLRLTQLSDAHPTQTLFYQLVGGCVLLLPLAFLMGQAEIYWTGLAIGSLIFHTIVVSFISFMLWFWLLRNYLANRLGVFSFLTPIFGMLFGVLFLNEQIELNFLFGAAMVMLGVMIVSLHHWIEKKLYSQVKTNEWSE